MDDLQHRKRLRPFHKVADAPVDILKADEGHKQEHAAEDGEPEDCADEIVED